MQDKDYRIDENLPESLNANNVHELAKTIDEAMLKLNALSELIKIYPRIDELSSDFIDALAIQFHCDAYDTSLPLATRRQIVKRSIPWHMRKGTVAVVKEIVAAILGNNINVKEWFEYNGKPYRFKLITEESVTDLEKLRLLIRAIKNTKNVRSWLEAIQYRVTLNLKMFAVTSEYEREVLSEEIKTLADGKDNVYVGIGSVLTKRTEIYGAEFDTHIKARIHPFVTGGILDREVIRIA